jgi:HEPN domain-containing protein
MAQSLRRADCQAISAAKCDDAVLLLANGRYSNAYYLAGYAVEIALKACIARQISAESIPDKNFILDTFKHDFRTLIGVAGLSRVLKEAQEADPDFAANWALVSEWKPDVRYEVVDPVSAQFIAQAITDPNSGVLKWIKAYW